MGHLKTVPEKDVKKLPWVFVGKDPFLFFPGSIFKRYWVRPNNLKVLGLKQKKNAQYGPFFGAFKNPTNFLNFSPGKFIFFSLDFAPKIPTCL
ncbi:MAG: hypothetical protein CM15mP32_5090 [Flavobacteriaceae bacterium]|nr:MAG: hypothetical protein CM15mP32_5090 [Flavobacteriaceae bacterium]